jgi:hypothetical protein
MQIWLNSKLKSGYVVSLVLKTRAVRCLSSGEGIRDIDDDTSDSNFCMKPKTTNQASGVEVHDLREIDSSIPLPVKIPGNGIAWR